MDRIEWPHSRLPLLPSEVQKAREEDPGFAEIFGRAVARARGVEYQPELHYPYRGYRGDLPTSEREQAHEELRDLVDRWSKRWFRSPDGGGADGQRG
jgi:hypothetical protein